jgi:hypothetical protein
VLVLNIFLPGIGTLVSSCLLNGTDSSNSGCFLILAFVHLLLPLIGWIMAIIYGIQVVLVAEKSAASLNNDIGVDDNTHVNVNADSHVNVNNDIIVGNANGVKVINT